MYWNVEFPNCVPKLRSANRRKPCHHTSWFYKLAAIVGLESSSEKTELISDVRGVPLDIAGKDHSMIYKQIVNILQLFVLEPLSLKNAWFLQFSFWIPVAHTRICFSHIVINRAKYLYLDTDLRVFALMFF